MRREDKEGGRIARGAETPAAGGVKGADLSVAVEARWFAGCCVGTVTLSDCCTIRVRRSNHLMDLQCIGKRTMWFVLILVLPHV